ncbi:hydroxycarboxylic acid receptor 3-like [Ambystoma mexicanum]|uniref:hydroxycarboxylic acid receptor 3-like n=1 Tax=Ambystoma mexicanum TaxID=8296 RepID=UPI0037E838FB
MSVNNSCRFVGTQQSAALALVLLVEFGIGLLGNGVALWIFCFRMTSWKASTVYLFNLSLADVLLIFCLPFRACYFMQSSNWHFGNAPCSLMLFMVSLNRAGSIFFLTLVAVDRYFKVVHPYHRINTTTKMEAVVLAVLMWSVIVAMTIYILTETHLINGEVTNTTLCESFDFNRNLSSTLIWHNIFFVAEFAVPLVVILFCTGSIVRQLKTNQMGRQGKTQRAVKSVTAVIFVFIFCFLPSTVAIIAVSISKGLSRCYAGYIFAVRLDRRALQHAYSLNFGPDANDEFRFVIIQA